MPDLRPGESEETGRKESEMQRQMGGAGTEASAGIFSEIFA